MLTICSVLGMLGICSIEDILKKEIQSIRVLCFGIGGILLHLWQRNQSLYSMLGCLLYTSCSRHPAQMCFLQFQTIRSPLSLWKINPLFTKYNQKNPIYTKKGIFFFAEKYVNGKEMDT